MSITPNPPDDADDLAGAIGGFIDRLKAERDQLRAELATERGRLDWVFENYVVEAKDFRRGNRYVYYLDNREDLIVEMKRDAT